MKSYVLLTLLTSNLKVTAAPFQELASFALSPTNNEVLFKRQNGSIYGLHGCSPRDTILNPTFNHNFDNWTVVGYSLHQIENFAWSIQRGGANDQPSMFAKNDPSDDFLYSAHWDAVHSYNAVLKTVAVGELWQRVDICPNTLYQLQTQFWADNDYVTLRDCHVQLNISGSASNRARYNFRDTKGNMTAWNTLVSDTINSGPYFSMLIGIQLQCPEKTTMTAIANIDDIKLATVDYGTPGEA